MHHSVQAHSAEIIVGVVLGVLLLILLVLLFLLVRRRRTEKSNPRSSPPRIMTQPAVEDLRYEPAELERDLESPLETPVKQSNGRNSYPASPVTLLSPTALLPPTSDRSRRESRTSFVSSFHTQSSIRGVASSELLGPIKPNRIPEPDPFHADDASSVATVVDRRPLVLHGSDPSRYRELPPSSPTSRNARARGSTPSPSARTSLLSSLKIHIHTPSVS